MLFGKNKPTAKQQPSIKNGEIFILKDINEWFGQSVELRYNETANTLEALYKIPFLTDRGGIEEEVWYGFQIDVGILNFLSVPELRDRIINKRDYVLNKYKIQIDDLDKQLSKEERRDISKIMIEEWTRFSKNEEEITEK